MNAPFISEEAKATGWLPPYPENLSLREITLSKDTNFYRVFTDPNNPAGRFLARESEVLPYLHDPNVLRTHLGLPNEPIYIANVNVPVGAKMIVGRIGPQPNFGLMHESGFQYQLTTKISPTRFVNPRLLVEENLRNSYK